MKTFYPYIPTLVIMFLIITVLPVHAQVVNITTVTCNTNCAPSYSNYVGTVNLTLACGASSPASYTGQLTVNGVFTPVSTQVCSVKPVVKLYFSLFDKVKSSLENVYALVKTMGGVEHAFASK